MTRLLPDAERLTLALARSALSTVEFGTDIPDDIATRLPFVVIRRGGGAAINPRFLDQPVVSVDAWHSSKAGASDLAEDVRVALLAAWEDQTVTEFGSVSAFSEESGPSELRTDEQPDTIFRYQANYAISTRPPRR